METAPTSLATKNPVELLTPAERGAYERFLRSGKAPLGPDLAGRLFESFLNGRTIVEIHRDHSELNLGAIIAARVEYGWDALRAEHMQKLMSQAQDRALRAQLRLWTSSSTSSRSPTSSTRRSTRSSARLPEHRGPEGRHPDREHEAVRRPRVRPQGAGEVRRTGFVPSFSRGRAAGDPRHCKPGRTAWRLFLERAAAQRREEQASGSARSEAPSKRPSALRRSPRQSKREEDEE
jgi:hypothetical protein